MTESHPIHKMFSEIVTELNKHPVLRDEFNATFMLGNVAASEGQATVAIHKNRQFYTAKQGRYEGILERTIKQKWESTMKEQFDLVAVSVGAPSSTRKSRYTAPPELDGHPFFSPVLIKFRKKS